MKIGILYICTGRYDVFWKDFHATAEQFLLSGMEKHYFVFTDSDHIHSSANIHKIYQDKMGWPNDTLLRFELFLKIRDQLQHFDHLFFFNANYTFVKTISPEEFFPLEKDHFLVGQWHPVAYHKQRAAFDYESNPHSTAYIPPTEGKYYYAGGLIGGRTPEFLQMCEALAGNIKTDLANNIMAKWHDESHINKYFSMVPPKRLHPGYCYPQGWYLPFEQKTLLRDKSLLGGHAFLRGQEQEGKDIFHMQAKLFKGKLVMRALLFKILGYSPL